MHVLAIDVTNPDQPLPLLDRATGEVLEQCDQLLVAVENAGDGRSRLVLESGEQLEQVPGKFGLAKAPKGGAYGSCKISGALVAWHVHPDYPALVLSLAELP
jgi:hypothetical protein